MWEDQKPERCEALWPHCGAARETFRLAVAGNGRLRLLFAGAVLLFHLFVLLLLRIVQDSFDLAVAVPDNTSYLRLSILGRQARVIAQGLHLLIATGEDRFDLCFLIR